MLGLAASLQRGGASLLTFVKDNLKLYLDFKSNKSDTLKFPSEGSTSFDGSNDYIDFGDISDFDNATNLTMVMWAKRLESNDAVTFEKSSGYTHRVSINISTDGNVYANLATGSNHAFGSSLVKLGPRAAGVAQGLLLGGRPLVAACTDLAR